MRVGLLTRFFATLGMALGVALLLIPYQYSLLAVSIWFAWLGFTLPRPRPDGPPAGVGGRRGDPVAATGRPGAAEPQPAVVEGDASEVFAEPTSRPTTRRAASGRASASASAAAERRLLESST